MPRSIQSSHYSSSYGGSQSSSLAGRSISPGQEDDYEGDKAFGNGIMGVMYTVCKEKDKPSVVFMAFRLLADWLQLWMLVVNPAWFNIPRPALWWQILYFISLNDFISARGNTFYLACFYLLVFGLLMSVVVSLWVGASFQNNRFEYVWPIVFLRIFGKIFYQILDIMSVSLFLIALDCQYFAVPDEQRGINAELGVACWAMPHLIHAGVAVLALILFLVLASLFCMGEMELSFTTKNPLAIMHTGVEMRTFGLRMTMAFVAVFVNSLKWQSAAQLALTSYLVWLLWFWQPQMTGWVNHFRTGTYLSVWWTTLLFLLLAFGIGVDLSDDHATLRHQARLTTVMWATFFPVGLLGALASWLRLRYFHRTVLQRFRGKTSLDKPWEVYEVTDSRQVEILARCCRVWVDRDTLDPEAVLLAETVLKCGIAQRPKDPFMIVLISSFLIDVQSSYQSGYSQLQVAKRLDLNFLMRFAIFSREQQHTQRSGMSGQADDLVSYVEYTRNHALALRVHREALNSMRTVWEILLHAHVRFQTLAEAISRMDAAIKAADRVYKSVLARHLGHIQMVRLYAKFLEHVKHDPWGAAKWFAEAEKLESVEEDQKNQDAIDGLDVSDPELRAAMMSAGPLGGTGANPRCVIIINAQGQIQMTNRALLDVFGYTKAEIRERNVGLLMPPSTAAVHNTYLRNYITSGQPKILNQTIEQLAMTKDRRLLPVSLMVTKISGIAEDSSFLGILEPIAPAPDTATIWVSLDGGILGVDAQFTDWFAFTSGEVHGWALSRLVTKQSKALQQCMMRARASLHSRHFLTSAPADSSMSVAKMAAAEGSAHNPSLPLGTGSVVRNVPSNPMFQLHSAPSVLLPQRPTSNFNWQAEGVGLAHKYAEPQDVDVTVANAGGGAVLYHVLTLRARQILAQAQLSSVASLPNALSGVQPPAYFQPHTDVAAQAEISSKGSNQRQDTPSASGVADSTRQKVVEGPDAVSGNQSLGRHGMGLEDTPRPHTQPTAPQAEGAQGSQRAVRRSSTLIVKEATQPTLSSIQPLMVVADSRGRVCHVTLKMAELLGRSVEALRANGMEHAFSALLPEPFSHMHHSLLQATASSVPPPHSCRSGLIQLLQRTSGQGQTEAVPFQLQIKRRTGVEAVYHVATFTEATMEQALDERRLLLEVDADGLITGVSSGTPASLFALDPATLPGLALDAVLDFMHPTTAQDGEVRHHRMSEANSQVLLELAARAAEEPGLSWRVGVGMAGAQTAPTKLKGKARTMLGNKTKPAIMTISVAFDDPHMASLDSMQIMVELWRADLACSVIEVNASGQVVPLGCDELNALCPSGLVLGAPLSVLLDQPLSSLLPCLAGKSLTDLFHEGALGPPPSGFAAAAPALKAAEKKGGRARAKGLSMSEMRSSPTHIIRVPHLADAADMTLSLQVVRKSGSPGYFVVLHPLAPRTSRPGLAMFLLGEPAPDAQGHAAVTDGRAEHRKRRASMEFLCTASLTRPSQPVLGSLAMTSHPLLKPSHQARASFQVPEQPPVPLHPGQSPSTVPDPPTSHGQPSRQQPLIQGDIEDVEQTLVESLAANSSKGGVTGQGTHTELEGVSRRSSLREEELDASSTSSSQAEVVTRTVSGKPSSRDAMIMAWLHGDQGPGTPQDSPMHRSAPAPPTAPADSLPAAPDAPNALGAPVKERSSPHSQASFTKVVWRSLPAASLSAPPLPQPVLEDEASVRGGRLLQAIARGSVRAGNQWFQAGSGSMAMLRLSEVGEGKAGAGTRAILGARARLSWEPAGVVPGADEAWARNSGGSMPSLREGAAGEQEAEELEDAEALDNDDTIGDSHYLRGKRFKKLFKLLSSDVVQQPVQRYRTHTLFLVLLLIAAHTGCFALMYTIVGTQSQLVATLGDVGTAGILATEVATFSRTLNMHYSNMTVPDGPGGPGLRLASSPEDLPYLKQLLSEHADAFYTMHQKAYAGMARAGGRLPTKDGLRDLWDADSLKGIVFTNIAVNQSLGNFSTLNLYNSTKLMGLWTAGNQLAAKARSLLQNGEAYLRTLGPSIADFMYNPDLLYIVTNGPNLVFEGYKSTMDIYMQIVISSSASANNLQLVLLAAEGGVLCLLCVVWVWLLLRAVAERRYQMYQILMVVPGGLVRRMATQRQRLGDESEDEEDERMLTAPTLTAQMAVRKSQKAPGIRFEQDAEDVEEGAVHTVEKGRPGAAAAGGVGRAGPGSCWQALLRGLGWVPAALTSSKQESGKGSKRQLSPSVKTSLWLIWPIAVWGPTVMLFYAIGFQLMATINGPISLFNIVSFTQLLYNANNFFLQELTFEPNPANMPQLRASTVQRIKELEMHYKVMLYGHESVPTTASAPYITLVSSGVTYTGSHGNYILFDTKECLASNKSECQPPSSPLYPWTHSGLDTMMSHYMEIGTSITQFQYLDPYLNGPEYNFYWNTIPDMSGGFERLSEAYQVFVNDNLRVVLSLHICLFVFTLVLMAVYVGLMVLPFVKVTRNETRRIAELVSQLPAEVDMEATLAKAQMAELLLGPAVPPPYDAMKSSKSLKKSRSLSSGSSR